MASTIDKVKHVLHLDHDKSTTHSHTTGTHTGTAEGVAGPHSSRAANAADPRIDSDLDGSRNAGAHTTHTTHHTGAGTGLVGSTGQTSHNGGLTGNHTGTTGITGTHTTTGNSTTAGPHSSNLANKLDPRVDSDLDGSRNLGASSNHGTTGGAYTGTHTGNTLGNHTGTTGGISSSTNAGPHNSNLANKVDPLVDSDLDGRGNRHGASHTGVFGASGSHATAGSGTAQNTAGPHDSDLANKLDPRVDADRDGSKTYGGNKTYA
jgi:hypothetical protein